MKALKAKNKILERKQTKTLLTEFQLFIVYKPACLQKCFDGQALPIRVFSSDGHYGLIVATFRLEYEDDYEYDFPYWARALGFDGENFRSARAQNLKLELVVVLVLQSEGR